MKTSNRILFTLLVVVFSTPLFLFMAFKTMIKNGEYTQVDNNAWHSKINAFSNDLKVLKLEGPDNEVLTCNLIMTDASSYSEEIYYGNDSLKIERHGDTLLVRYVDVNNNPNSDHSDRIPRQIDIQSHSFNTIIAAGATIHLDANKDSVDPVIIFDLKNNAHLKLGQNDNTNMASADTDTASDKSSGRFNKLIINAVASNISIDKFTQIADLNMQIQGRSVISIDDQSRIDRLSGSISDSSTVNANWPNIRKLAALTK